MKSVLISIRPQWCEKIANGEKTIEVRKTRPKLETPFKCYVYCTKDNTDRVPSRIWWKADKTGFQHILNGKVIGEFVCDRFIESFLNNNDGWFVELGCLTATEINKYQGDNPTLYGWHISELVIYDTPKKLSEFRVPCSEYCEDKSRCGVCEYYYCEDDETNGFFYDECTWDGLKPMTRPPQSWCYVEGGEG